ncbi:MAG: UDP-3-O-(3-hydroxymyristoyl)glucosamine N-acyltransferase [Bacteroidetes bacterium]|nr:UDP-3-O-(3-hydroxymyristoyl)glucosamine N-acyltransferase [Bacteroidota bacterium]
MEFTAQQIAQLIGGNIEGNPEVKVSGFGKIEEAGAGQLTFLANPKYEEFLYNTSASLIIINESLELKQPVGATLIRVPDAYTAFATLLQAYEQLKAGQLNGIQQPAFVSETATLGTQVFVGAFSYIGNQVKIGNNVKIHPQVYIGEGAEIGDHTILKPGVKIGEHCIIGKNVIIHPGTVIGSDGFGFAPQSDGSYKKVPQIGNVMVEDYVEIGSNCSIDRATMGSTIIRKGAKLDNLIQVAHNVEIGENTAIAAQTGVSGSTKIGKNVMIGGQAGIVGHITIADGSRINAQSGVSKSIKVPNSIVTGSPAHDYTSTLRSQAVYRNLPQLEKRISELEEMIKKMEAFKSY